jgi:trehalose 6-phosphate phosphatase
VVHEARQSVELRPPLDVDKGSVVRRIAIQRRLEAACFIGDDLGDLPALAAVGELRHGLRVAVRSAEAPAELLAAADVVVDGPPGALAFLRAVAQSARAAAS